MKKHIIGFAVFSLIIGSTVFVKAVFNTSKEIIVPAAENYSYTNVTKNSCWRMKRKSAETQEAFVRQAFLDLNTKRIDWEIYVPQAGSVVALHFFAKTARGSRYIATEIAPVSDSSGEKIMNYSSLYISLSSFSPYENLYVVPEVISAEDAQMKNFDPKFDEVTATPVSVYARKD